MGSSNFSSPFFQKSPLQGAYGAGADGIVPVSYDDIHKDFQKGVADNVAKAYTKKENPCNNLVQKLSENKISNAAYETLSAKCAKKTKAKEKDVETIKPSNPNIPKATPEQIAAQYGELDPTKSTSVIPKNNSIFSGGMVHKNHPCPPGQSRDPITGMCN